MTEPKEFVEWGPGEAFSAEETDRIRATFDESVCGKAESFTAIPRDSAEWVYDRMVALALQADAEAGWGLLKQFTATHTDQIVYDRFGPPFSDPEFKWHVDASEGDPRLVSVVAYLSDSDEYEGGRFEMELGGDSATQSRVYQRGAAVAFPSKRLRHVVHPVTKGERRSFLLLVGDRATFGNWHVG